jgi:5-amino-6-(5-phosphoribosylamino)uracil reductase
MKSIGCSCSTSHQRKTSKMSVIVTNVMAVSLDGKIGKHPFESDADRSAYGFSNLDDKEWVRSQLVLADVVITGANSMRASGASWEVQNDRGVNPAWIVWTRSGLDDALPFWRQMNIRRILVSPAPIQQEACAAYGVENWVIKNTNEPKSVLDRLEKEGLTRVLLFGGGSINKIFYENRLVDFAKITLCPLIVGGVTPSPFIDVGLPSHVNLDLISSFTKGSLVFLTYKIQK